MHAIIWIDDFGVTKYQIMADVMISDTSSTIYEFLLLNKPVITFRAVAKDLYWKNITEPSSLCQAYQEVLTDKKSIQLRQWIIDNYDPYLDGEVAHRMLQGARDYICRHAFHFIMRFNCLLLSNLSNAIITLFMLNWISQFRNLAYSSTISFNKPLRWVMRFKLSKQAS